VIAILWIAFSDAVVTYLKLPPAVMTIKGIVFVFVTASLLYFTIRRLVQAVQLASEALRRSNRELRAISNCNQVLLRATDEQSLLQEICRIVCEEAGYRVAWVGYAEHDEAKSVRPVAWTGAEDETLASLGITWADTEHGRGPSGTAIRTGRTSCIEDYATDPRVAPWRENALRHGFRSAIALPLKDEHANAFGALNIYSSQPCAFPSDEIRLLEELAGDMAFGIVTLRSQAARQRAEEALREGETRFRTFVDHAADALFIYDFDQGTIVDVNQQACESLGFTRQELIGTTAVDFHLDSDRAHIESVAKRAAAGESVFDTHWHRRKDGTLFPVEAHTSQYWYGGRRFLLKVARDVTERHQAEENLRESEQRYRRIVDTASEGIWELDERYVTTLVNRRMAEMLGYEPQEMAGRNLGEFLFEDDVADLPARIAARRQGLTERYEQRYRHKDGSTVWMYVSATSVRDAGLRFIGSFAMLMDITERKRAEEEARNTAAQWQATFDAVQDMVLLLDKDFQILRANRAAAEFLGLPFDKIVGGHCFNLIHGTTMPPAECPLARMRQSRRHEEVQVLARKGGPWLSVSVDPVFDQNGELTHVVHVARDITERKRAEDALRRSEACLAEGQRLSHTGSWAWSPVTLQPLYWSEEMSRIYGLNPQEDVPTAEVIWQRIHPEDRDRFRELQMKVAQRSSDYEHDHRIVLPDGTVKHIHAIGHPVRDEAGKLVEYVGTAMDVTERKRAEDALRRNEAYLAEGQRLVHMGSWAWSPATLQALYWSEEMFRIFGVNPQEGASTAETFWQRIHPEDLERTRGVLLKAAAGNMEYEHDHRIVLPDGTIKHIHAVGHPVLDENGQVVEYVGTAVDVTERKFAEDELHKHREHLEDLVKQRTAELAVLNQLVYGSLESGEVGAMWIDFKEADTLHALDNTAGMLGLEPDPTGEKTYKLSNWTNLLADTAVAFPDYAPIIEEARERLLGAISGKYKNYRAVYPLAMPGGSLKWIDARAEIAKRGDYGQALLMTGTLIDITRLKQAEADLAEAKARAEAANRAKSTFLANMSHELRTPLNAVLGFSRLLKKDPDVTPQQQETLDVIVRSGEHLLNLINNVLDMAKIESGRVALKESEVDLNQLMHEMQSLMGVGAVEKGLRFALERDPDLPRFVAVDAGKLRQVLLNLLGNAIKYTDSGGVKLRARLASIHGSEKAKVRFEVDDSGPGISQEDCTRIFFPFVQLGGQASAQAGTGLGLAICKQYVELMGGQIGVTSKPGKGSVFYFEIPVRVLPSVAERDDLKNPRILGLAEGQPRYRLLIVEDQPENRLLLRRILEPLGFELREAANGQEAVALFEQWHPNLIWMDIRMPVMDGLEAARRIRATKAGADTKIIALTAHALEEEREPIMAAGCDDLVRKPIREQELFGALARHLRLKFIYEKASPQESAPEAPGLALRPEQLDALPAELLQDLRHAVVELDTARTRALIKQVTERDASLGRALETLATRLDYKRLLKLLKKEHNETGQMI
jgi:PAS domain S-box-containing protein